MKTENRNERVVFTMGGKGGVGKTGLMVALAIDNGSAAASTRTSPNRPSLITKPWDRVKEHQGPEMLEKLSDQTGGLPFRVRTSAEAKGGLIKAGRSS